MFSRKLVFAALGSLALFASACEDDGIGQVSGDINADQEIDFGDVPNGLKIEKSIKIVHSGGAIVSVTAVVPDAATFGGQTHLFEVKQGGFKIAPGSTSDLTVSFRAFAAMDEPVESFFVIKSDVRELTVKVKGRGIGGALLFDPEPVDFGTVLTGSSEERDFKVTNISAYAVDLRSERGNDGAPLVTSSGTGRFDILAMVDAGGSLLAPSTKLEPGASAMFSARYSTDVVASGREDRGRWKVSYCSLDFCDQELHLIGNATQNAVACTPPQLEFGAVNPGRTVVKTAECTNLANDPVQLLGWSIEGTNAGEFTEAPSATRLLMAGESEKIDVTFHPGMGVPLAQPLEALLRVDVASDDGLPLDPVRVALIASAGGPQISVSPDRLSFGQVAVGTTLTRRLLVSNNGYSELVVSSINSDVTMTTMYSADPLLFVLPVGSSTVVNVTFAPTAEGDFPSVLVVNSNDASNPMVPVMLSGQGLLLPPCSYSLAPNPVTFGAVTINQSRDIGVRFTNTGTDDCLMNDIIIDDQTIGGPVFTLVNGEETGLRIAPGVSHDMPVRYTPQDVANDAADLTFYVSDPNNSQPRIPLLGVGEATTEIACPANLSTPAGTPVSLGVNIMTRGTNVTSISWGIVSAPPGGIGTPNQWNPDPPNTANVDFLAYIVGVYQLHVVVTDDVGTEAACDFNVTAEGHGLRTTMTWDGSGDVDLHVTESTTQPWFSSPSDCYYSNRTPLWDAASPAATGPNPQLDFDNTSGFGPENTTIDIPIIGHVYTIAAHNFSASAGRIVTIDIFCGGVTSPTATFMSNPLQGSTAGNCTGNDFWKVATVEFTSLTSCIVTPINTTVASSSACLSY